MYAKAAANTFFLINYRNPVFVICNRVYRTAEFTWPFQICNRMIRAGFCAFTAFLAFRRVNMGTMAPNGNRIKIACIDTCLSNTVLAVVCYNITGNRAVLARRMDYLYDIAVVYCAWRFAFRKADSLTDNFPFFVNTATKLRVWPRNQLIGDMIPFFFQISLQGGFSHFV